MAKKIQAIVKLQIEGGAATAAPPVGPALGQHGANIMAFVKEYNEKTSSMKGDVIPVEITIFQDKSFTFELKSPPAAALIIMGNPISLAISSASLTLEIGLSEPFATGSPASAIIFLAEILSPKIFYTFELGPMNLIPSSDNLLANVGFSARKPYPG